MYTITCYNFEGRKLAVQNQATISDAELARDRMKLNLEVDQVRITYKAFNITRAVDTWERSSDTADEIWIVHSVNTVGNEKSTASRNTAHPTEAAAIKAAKKCVESWGNDHPGVYIFKAMKHVKRTPAPIEVVDL